jgi:hypothetical protein
MTRNPINPKTIAEMPINQTWEIRVGDFLAGGEV